LLGDREAIWMTRDQAGRRQTSTLRGLPLGGAPCRVAARRRMAPPSAQCQDEREVRSNMTPSLGGGLALLQPAERRAQQFHRTCPCSCGTPGRPAGLRPAADEGRGRSGGPTCGSQRGRHAVLAGSVRSHAIVFVTPEARRAQALLRAAVSASRSVAASTARHARPPPNSMHTSQRTPPAWKLV